MLTGDVGIGFQGCPYPEKFPDNIRLIRGNHDAPEVCRKHPNYLGDWGYIKEIDLFYVSGAWSIDYKNRTIGIDWWEDEELSYLELTKVIEEYKRIKPKYMVSHDCPMSVAMEMFDLRWNEKKQSKTSIALDEMFKSWQPEYQIFSHWHDARQKVINGTKFIALDMFVDIEEQKKRTFGNKIVEQSPGVSYEIPGIGWNGKTE